MKEEQEVEKISEFKGQYRFLSNFYLCPAKIEMDGLYYKSVEHAFQAAKTLDLEDRVKIMLVDTAGTAKAIGRAVRLRPDWDKIKRMIMTDLVRKKFSGADPLLKQALLQTGDAELEEGNYWNDTYWGVCRGVGENWLGKILMLVREELMHPVSRDGGKCGIPGLGKWESGEEQ